MHDAELDVAVLDDSTVHGRRCDEAPTFREYMNSSGQHSTKSRGEEGQLTFNGELARVFPSLDVLDHAAPRQLAIRHSSHGLPTVLVDPDLPFIPRRVSILKRSAIRARRAHLVTDVLEVNEKDQSVPQRLYSIEHRILALGDDDLPLSRFGVDAEVGRDEGLAGRLVSRRQEDGLARSVGRDV